MTTIRCVLVLVGVLCAAAASQEIRLRECVVLRQQGRAGRAPIQTGDVLHAWAIGGFDAPAAGQEFRRVDGSIEAWASVSAGEDGWVRSPALRGGFASFSLDVASEGAYLLDARSHSMVLVNGEAHAGNPYGFDFTRLPVRLRAGRNDLTFLCGRGQVWARLIPIEREFDLLDEDRTLPDLIAGEPTDSPIGVLVLNASDAARDDLVIRTILDGGEAVLTPVGWLEGVSTRKVAARLVGPAIDDAASAIAQVALLDGDGNVLAEDTIALSVRGAADKHVRTFVSEIDGSCQYYAITPRRGEALEGGTAPALILTLHGASVEGSGQAAAYGHKDWADIVAPTNRRPFGFDWEDWGRKDAIEVLDIAGERLGSDPRRTYLTGHSMGGHGTWHIGVSMPARFAAIAPSAGWVSFWSYTGAARYENATGVEAILSRASSPSDTLELERNLDGLGVYVLHGDADDNVPVDQARTMRGRLASFHADFAYYERPGAGHWWGNQCVDWPELLDFFKRRSRGERVDRVRFGTMSPAVSASRDWATIVQQEHALRRSSVDLAVDRSGGRISGSTENVARLGLDLESLELRDRKVTLDLDGQTIEVEKGAGSLAVLSREGGSWGVGDARDGGKAPARMGPFKEVFDRRCVLVYGTRGSEAESAQSRAKALFDAQTFWYRGNGAFLVIPDIEFDASRYGGRNVVLYGNADTNGAWTRLLGDSPVRIERGRATIGGRSFQGDDLGLLLVRPHPDGEGLVGVIGGSGLPGSRALEHLPVFVSGVAYPDVTLMRASTLLDGTAGIEAAGFFGNDWSLERGEVVFSK